MNANEAMIVVANQIARERGFIEVTPTHKMYAKNDSFWGNKVLGCKSPDVYIETCKYIYPLFDDELEKLGEYSKNPTIDIDMFWGNPRLNVRISSEEGAHITFSNEILSDVQAFGERGLDLAVLLKTRINKLMVVKKDWLENIILRDLRYNLEHKLSAKNRMEGSYYLDHFNVILGIYSEARGYTQQQLLEMLCLNKNVLNMMRYAEDNQ